jgi:hypothetical protein
MIPISQVSFVIRLARARLPGRLAFKWAIVPLCFTLQMVVPASVGMAIVLNCSSRPFYEKTAKNHQISRKTMEQLGLGLPHGPPKKH